MKKRRPGDLPRSARKRASRAHFDSQTEGTTLGLNNKPPEKIIDSSDVKPKNGTVAKPASAKMTIQQPNNPYAPRNTSESYSLTIAQRLKRGRQIRRIKPKIQRAAKMSLTRAPSNSNLIKRSKRAARNILKKRYSPVRGMSYNKLSTTQKIMVDRIVSKKQRAIKNLAKRLLPKVRRQAFQRITNNRKNIGMPKSGQIKFRINKMFEDTFKPLPVIVESMINDLDGHPMAESFNTIYSIAANKSSPAVKSLKEKASKAGVSFDTVLGVYSEALETYYEADTKLTSEQYAFNAVNAFVAGKKNINDLWVEKVTFKRKEKGDEPHKGHQVNGLAGSLKLSDRSPDGNHLYTYHPDGDGGEPVKLNGKTRHHTKAEWKTLLDSQAAKVAELEKLKVEAHGPFDWGADLLSTVTNALIPPPNSKLSKIKDAARRTKHVVSVVGGVAVDSTKDKLKKLTRTKGTK